MNTQTNKRNYIRRKKYLNECADQIKGTLEFIAYARGETIVEEHITKVAFMHAEGIEAACWSPHTRISSDNYQALMSSKTKELCRIILKQSFPNLDFHQLQQTISQRATPVSKSEAPSEKSSSIPTPQFDPTPKLDPPPKDHPRQSPISSEVPRSLTPRLPFPLPMIPSSAPTHLSPIETHSINFDIPSFDSFQPENGDFMDFEGIPTNVDNLLTFDQDKFFINSISNSSLN